MSVHAPHRHFRNSVLVALVVALLVSLAMLVLSLAPTQAQPPAPVTVPVVTSTEPYIEYAPNTALVKLKAGVALSANPVRANGANVTSDAQSLNSLLQAFGATAAEPVFGETDSTTARAGRPSRAGLERIYRVQWTAQVPVDHAVAALAADPAVEYAEPDYIARAARTPNDPEYASQWALPKINAPAAWDITTGNSDVIIAVIDSGVDTAHPDFAGRLWENDDPVDGVDNDLNGKVDDLNGWNIFANSNDLIDPNGHGSEVGGVVGAGTDNGVGVAGMCWTCKLMFVNAMQPSFVANYSDVAAAVQYAASNGAQVINLSLGGYADSAMLRDAIGEAAITAVIVGGAGNDDSGAPFYPAAYPEVLAVAATDNADQKAVFSNYGPWVDVSAPGKDIRTTTVGGYATGNGTSLAAPFVSGLAGLIKSQHTAWTPEQVKWQILNTAVNIDGLNPTRAGQLGKGRINAGVALSTAPQARATVEGYTIDGQASARPAPGQALQLALNLRNLWLLAQNLQGTLTSSDPYVNITDNAGAFGDIAPGQLGGNSGNPFGLTVAGNAPYNHQLQFTLNLSGVGGYSLAVPFTVQVRSAVETLGNTIYTQNTIWTSDKTYVLNGSVIVNTGVTLTIQPGTVVKGNPGKFMRVDGTLIAQGAPGQPIVFTNATEGSNWSGIRFTASAVDASFDAAGNYSGGSILQHVEMRHADLGLSLAGRAPHIADSLFADNGGSIQTWADGAVGGLVRVERNRFNFGGIDASGGATIVHNVFQGNGDCSIMLSGGSPLIMQNTFTGASCGINGSVAFPAVVSNTLSGGMIQLGQSSEGNGTQAPLPPFLAGPKMTQVAAGGVHTCGLLANSNIQCWGWGLDSSNTPQTVAGLAGSATQLAVGGGNSGDYTCALLADGSAHCWGLNEYGQLGTGNNADAIAPKAVVGLAGSATQLAAGYAHTCALLADGKVQCWGYGGYGQLGTGGNGNASVPQTVAVLAGTVIQVDAGWGHTCALLADGSVQCWGDGALGQLGVSTPPTVTGLAGAVTQLATGSYHTCALLTDGNAQCWGWGVNGQLGTGNNDSANTPQTVTGLAGSATQLAAGYLHTCALLVDGKVQCWGYGGYGQLGTGNIESANTPQIVTGLAGSVTQLAAGSHHTCALLADGDVQCWGLNDWGQLGTGNNESVDTPQYVVFGVLQIIGNVMQQGSGLSVGASSGALRVIGNVVQQGDGLSVNSGNALLRIQQNSLNASTANGLALICNGCAGEIVSNTIAHNQSYGIALNGTGLDRVTVHNNNLVANGGYDLYLTGGQAGTQNFTVDATSNFWNIDASQIPNRIRDCTFDDNGCGTASSTVGKVAYDPPLAAPAQQAPAFALSVNMTPDTLGMNQHGIVTIDFSAPMMTGTLPTASFHDARRGTTQQSAPGSAQVMTTDALGQIWFGLSEYGGVAKYDGRNWTSYTTANSGIGGNNITAMHGADNGDVWFAHSDGATALSRLQGSVWYTYPHSLPGDHWLTTIPAIGQDSQGAMWFASDGTTGIFRFDGSEWREFTTADGLASNFVQRIVRDGQGRMWFQTDAGLSVFDGVTWTTHDMTTGFPTNSINSLFADSQGRVWVGLGSYNSPDRDYLAVYDSSEWHYWGTSETGGVISCDITGFAEAPNGTIWMTSNCGNFKTYQNGQWGTNSHDLIYLPVMFDSRGNLWSNQGCCPTQLQVLWRGLDYAFTDGQWLSPTRFQAAYTFDANILPGYYTVQADGAVGSDGITAYAGVSNTFQVDFGAGVTLDPPSPPQVTAQTNGSLNHLVARWQTSSPNIDQYRYAIGTTPGARNVVGWTYLVGTGLSRNDLNLALGQSYYVTAQARNTSGLWSVNGVSNGVVGGQAPSPTPTHTPTTTDTPIPSTSTPTATPTSTDMPVPPTATVTPTPTTPANTATATPTSTDMPVPPTATVTPTPTTPANTATATPTVTATPGDSVNVYLPSVQR